MIEVTSGGRAALELSFRAKGVYLVLDGDGAFWFLEVNARLQVEHGVTELVTDLDLVAEHHAPGHAAEVPRAARAGQLEGLARLTGGRVFNATKTPLAQVFKEIRGYQ